MFQVVFQFVDEYQDPTSDTTLRLRGFITPIKTGGSLQFVTYSFRSSMSYDTRHIKKCLNRDVSNSWPRGGDPYKLPNPNHPYFPVACIYEACDLQWEVDYIMEHRVSVSGLELRVKWLAISAEESTWEPVANLECSKSIIWEYCKQFPGNVCSCYKFKY